MAVRAAQAQRNFRADAQRIQNLWMLSATIDTYYTTHGKLPPGLDQLPGKVAPGRILPASAAFP